LILLACQGRIPTFDAAIFADTGWEPAAVYRNLDRLTRIAAEAGIPVVRVHKGHIRRDALDPVHRFASMPPFFARSQRRAGHGAAPVTKPYRSRSNQIFVPSKGNRP
jgi:hypothetical protein